MAGNFDKYTADRVLRATRRVEMLGPDASRIPHKRRPVSRFFIARIDEFLPISTNRWAYGFTAMKLDATKNLIVNEVGPTETAEGNFAINLMECLNTGTGVQGHSVNLDGEDYPAGFELQPIGGRQSFDPGEAGYGTIGKAIPVEMWTIRDTDGEVVYVFSVPNADDGTCSAS